MLKKCNYFLSRLGLLRDESGIELAATSNFSVINNTCLATTVCSTISKYYRNINGSCNSLNITNLGSANTDYRRLLAPAYSDGKYLKLICIYLKKINKFVLFKKKMKNFKEFKHLVWQPTVLLFLAVVW